jgi:hypothetical protein
LRIGLIGCVKSKRTSRARAKDLYTSPLFLGRRRFVESTCDRWFILSAEHGLVNPEEDLDPYDKTLTKASVSERRAWSRNVFASLQRELGDLREMTFEIHAGRSYYDFGLLESLQQSEASVELPVRGLPLGRQLAFYQRQR